ncbi:uncharacterized protein LOC118749141 [Rhagoletis pomonella]|uniref:uncharacterized protein LOC118749141 n=1 Tax=Rhagoletis pomonella TaxID=28610 RepID=UPI00177E51AF|nr:uncharacterized protein LOC118749141 [Rhagoletis pomonella]
MSSGLHYHPDQQEFKYRLRLYLLGHNKGVLSDSANVEEDDTPDIEITQPPLTSILLKNLSSNAELWPAEEAEFEDLELDGLEHLAGYICHKLQDDIPSTSFRSNDDHSFSWADHLNEGGLSLPSSSMMVHMRSLESVFKALNEDGLLITNDFVKTHIEHAATIQCDIKVKKLFFRARMFFKIRKLNKELVENAHKRKRKAKKTLT